MKNNITLKKLPLVLGLILSVSGGISQAYASSTTPTQKAAIRTDIPPLPIEETGRVEVLPSLFPESWMFVDEASFFSMFGGKIILLDVAEKKSAKRIKGTADKNLLGNFIQAQTRPEFYILESFHSRGSRGPKTDVLTIYDKTTMSPIKELIWKDTRLQALPRRHAMAISPDEKFLFASNFSPAASFTVVDLDTKEIVETIGTPGCVLTFATGKRSVTSICNNGGLLTSVIDDNGHNKSQHRIAPFFDTDKTPIFERPAIIDGIAYFPSFTGDVHLVDLNGEIAKYKGKWSLVSPAEKKANWRPSGLALNDNDEQGLFYLIMQPDGYDGSQTHGGTQVWIYNMKKKQRIKVIDIAKGALSIALTRGKAPLMVVTNGELTLDVYNPKTGELIQNINGFGNVTPLVIHKAY
jgi:methylamine dehydrogenase heavy chain